MSDVYKIPKWDSLFEGPKSRGYNNKSFTQMPSKHGLGYKRLVKRRDGAAIFGAWCALVQLLSRHPKPRDGWLTDNGKPDGVPYTPDDLECLTDIPARYFEAMLETASSQTVNWLELTTSRTPCGPHEDTTVSAQGTLDSDSDSDSDSDHSAAATSQISYKKIIEWWNDIAENTNRAKIRGISSARQTHVKARIANGMLDNLELIGQEVAAVYDATAWLTFDWIVQSQGNMDKLLEGKYRGKIGKAKPIKADKKGVLNRQW